MYLEGPEIIAENSSGTLTVPAAGRMVLSDRRERDPDRASSDVLGPGDALITWLGSMTMTRDEGRVWLDNGVAITHSRLADRQVTELEAQHADARLELKPGNASSGLSALA